MLLVGHESPSFWLVNHICLSFNLVNQHSIFVNDWTKNQVICPLLDELVSKSGRLIEPCRSSDSKDRLPGSISRQSIVKLVCESQSTLVILIVRVIEQAAIREPCKVAHCLQVLVNSFSYSENEQIHRNLHMSQVACLV